MSEPGQRERDSVFERVGSPHPAGCDGETGESVAVETSPQHVTRIRTEGSESDACDTSLLVASGNFPRVLLEFFSKCRDQTGTLHD